MSEISVPPGGVTGICGEVSGGLLCRFVPHPSGLHSWEGLVRKGALAEDRMRTDPNVRVACDDLARLADFGALAGVAEIIRERLRQVDPCGYDAAHDTHHEDGWLMHEAVRRVENAGRRVAEGIDGAEGIEEGCREAGALLAAEMDRLLLMLTPGEAYVCLAGHTHEDRAEGVVCSQRTRGETQAAGAPGWLSAAVPPDWWPPETDDSPWGGLSGWHLHLVHCRPDRCEIGCDCPHHGRAEAAP